MSEISDLLIASVCASWSRFGIDDSVAAEKKAVQTEKELTAYIENLERLVSTMNAELETALAESQNKHGITVNQNAGDVAPGATIIGFKM